MKMMFGTKYSCPHILAYCNLAQVGSNSNKTVPVAQGFETTRYLHDTRQTTPRGIAALTDCSSRLIVVLKLHFPSQFPQGIAVLRLTTFTMLFSGLVACSQAQSQETPVVERTSTQDPKADVAQIETQVKLTKFKNLLEEITKLELELASVVYVDQKDAERSEPLLIQKQKLLDKLKVEATATREQLDKLGVPLTKEQIAQNEAESKLWHETMEKFNGLVKEQKWREAEQLANEIASKFGSEDALIQGMLWTSINGERKAQGLAPLIRETSAPDAKTPIITLYSLKDKLPKADDEVPVFVDVLTQCISAAIEPGGTARSESKLAYDAENQRLVVVGSNPQHQLVTAILKRVNKTRNGEPPKTPTSAIETNARQAMTTFQNRLAWAKRFKIESISRYTRKDVGRIEDRSILASDGKQIIHRLTSDMLDKPADFIARSLTTFGLHTGNSFLGGTCITGQPMKTGGFTQKDEKERKWGLWERSCRKLDGLRAGNEGLTVVELLLKAMEIAVTKETLGEVPCFRVSSKDEWGTTEAWIESNGKNRLLQWESRKERGNKFSGRRHGEHRDTANYESTVERVTGIQYQEFVGIPIAVRGTVVNVATPNGRQEEHLSTEIERTSVALQPGFSDESVFEPSFEEGARITDWDSTNPDEHFRWRSGQLGKRQNSEIQLQSLLKLFPAADANNDGWLTQYEARECFPDADANDDGKLTPVEIRNYLARQKN